MTEYTEAHTLALARAFRAAVRADDRLTDYLAEIDARNPDYRRSGSCATHDFCDANDLMLEAWYAVFGTDADPEPFPTIDDSPQGIADADLWNRAWAMAADHGFARGDDIPAPHTGNRPVIITIVESGTEPVWTGPLTEFLEANAEHLDPIAVAQIAVDLSAGPYAFLDLGAGGTVALVRRGPSIEPQGSDAPAYSFAARHVAHK